MIPRVVRFILACTLFAQAMAAMPQPAEFSFAVISQSPTATDDTALRAAIAETDADNLAFVVASGFKSKIEPCSDSLYTSRKTLLNEAKNGLILSLTANDWAECKNTRGRSAALERLNLLRDLFFVDEFSFGTSKIPLVRQSSIPKFRSYVENTRWEIDGVLFATVNLPATNNHYSTEAGRNSEFEDRLIANRDWLRRIFSFAAHRKVAGIVLFCDGDPLATPGFQLFGLGGKRDGFAEVRRQINALTSHFSGKVLVIHGAVETAPGTSGGIAWNGNLGDLALGAGWSKVSVTPASATLFAVAGDAHR